MITLGLNAFTFQFQSCLLSWKEKDSQNYHIFKAINKSSLEWPQRPLRTKRDFSGLWGHWGHIILKSIVFCSKIEFSKTTYLNYIVYSGLAKQVLIYLVGSEVAWITFEMFRQKCPLRQIPFSFHFLTLFENPQKYLIWIFMLKISPRWIKLKL